MIKNKTILLYLIISLFCFQLSLPCSAMDDDEEYNRALIVMQNNAKLKKALEIENKELKEGNSILITSLNEADDLIKFLIQSPPTVHSYLSAVYNQAPNQELEELFAAATHSQFIGDIIIDGEIKFKAGSPISHLKLLKITGLLDNMRVSERYSTVTYGVVNIPPSPAKTVNKQAQALFNSQARQYQIKKENENQINIKEEHIETKTIHNNL